FGFAENTDDLFVGKTLLHGDVLMWLMKTLLTSGCTNQRGAGHRQYSRIFHGWVEKLGLEASLYSTHSMRRTKPYLIYKKTKNLRVIQLLLGHKKLESTVRYLGIEVDDALEISESIEV
ncbi:tyrosine-type recombinase/integrase, partial [Klebsiella pneumoniae]